MRKLFWAILLASSGACQTTVTEECDCIVPLTLSGRLYFLGDAKAAGVSEIDTEKLSILKFTSNFDICFFVSEVF